jgi:exodeoxyribonuclease-3
MPSTLKIASWNINSVRARLEIVEQFLREEQPDILCLQETKVIDATSRGRCSTARLHAHRAVRAAHAPWRRDPQQAADARGRPARLAGQWRGAPLGVRLECGIRLENVYVPAGGDIPDREQNPKFGQKLDFIERMTRWSEECACPTIWSATSTSRRSNATSGATSSC